MVYNYHSATLHCQGSPIHPHLRSNWPRQFYLYFPSHSHLVRHSHQTILQPTQRHFRPSLDYPLRANGRFTLSCLEEKFQGPPARSFHIRHPARSKRPLVSYIFWIEKSLSSLSGNYYPVDSNPYHDHYLLSHFQTSRFTSNPVSRLDHLRHLPKSCYRPAKLICNYQSHTKI